MSFLYVSICSNRNQFYDFCELNVLHSLYIAINFNGEKSASLLGQELITKLADFSYGIQYDHNGLLGDKFQSDFKTCEKLLDFEGITSIGRRGGTAKQ